MFFEPRITHAAFKAGCHPKKDGFFCQDYRKASDATRDGLIFSA
jgi:hypothetical protein